MNKELLNAAKDEAAREYRFKHWDEFHRCLNYAMRDAHEHEEAIINRAMEIYAERVVMTPELARRILGVRDAIVEKDYDEAWHELYQIASPNFDKQEPWEELEQIASIKTTKP